MNNWFLNSVYAMIGFSVSAIIVKYLNLKPSIILMYLFIISSIFYVVHNLNESITVNLKQFVLLIVLGVLSYLANYFGVIGLKQAPNPGFNTAVVESKIIVISLLSIMFFDAKFTLINLVGILLIIVGILLVIRG